MPKEGKVTGVNGGKVGMEGEILSWVMCRLTSSYKLKETIGNKATERVTVQG